MEKRKKVRMQINLAITLHIFSMITTFLLSVRPTPFFSPPLFYEKIERT